MLDEKTLRKRLKITYAAHHWLIHTPDPAEIAEVVNLSVERVEELMRSPFFEESLVIWGWTPQVSDLRTAQDLWTTLIENAHDLYPEDLDYFDTPFNIDENKSIKHLPNVVCIEDLSHDQIRERIQEQTEFESEPVRYEGQEIRGYKFWVYPNYPDGIWSSVFARLNVAGNLVVDDGDSAYLVTIADGRLYLANEVSDKVVLVTDKRLRVCL